MSLPTSNNMIEKSAQVRPVADLLGESKCSQAGITVFECIWDLDSCPYEKYKYTCLISDKQFWRNLHLIFS